MYVDHTRTLLAASLICSIVKTPKKSSSVTPLITANATSSTLTGGAKSRSDAGRELKGLVKFSTARRSFSAGSPTKSKGTSKPSTLLFPYMNPGLKTIPEDVNTTVRFNNAINKNNKANLLAYYPLKIWYSSSRKSIAGSSMSFRYIIFKIVFSIQQIESFTYLVMLSVNK